MSYVSPDTISHYKLLQKLGAGGMGQVFLAEDTKLNRKVAVKFLSQGKLSDPLANKRLIREARAAARLDHPNICAIHEIFSEDSCSYIVMQYVDGETLASKLKSGRLDLRETLSMAVQLSDALATAHSCGVIHRDIKPQNIMVSAAGQIKVLDFGLAKRVEPVPAALRDAETQSWLSDPKTVIGTVPYMSPEQVQSSEIDTRCDIFSCGTLLYEMITGVHPFSRTNAAATISAILTHAPAPLSAYVKNLPVGLEQIVNKCLQKDPSLRYASAQELSADLSAVRRNVEFGVVTSKLPSGPMTTSWRRWLGPALAATMFCCLALVAVYALVKLANRPKSIDSLAVLPLMNVGGDQNTEYICDGITENIINSLSRLPKLRIAARPTILRYKNQLQDPQVIGRQLNVSAVLTGKVTQQGSNLVIQVDLINVDTGGQIWGQRYNRSLSEILEIQDDIARNISDQLRLELTGDDVRRLTKRYTDNTESYLLYSRGRFFWNQRTFESLDKAIENFEKAIEIDPHYALAYAGLADTYMLLKTKERRPPKELMPKALENARKAIELDDQLAEAHTSLAAIKADYDWDWPEIEKQHRRALDLNPNYAIGHDFFAWYLISQGRLEEAKTEMRRAEELDPGSLIITSATGLPYYYSRQYDEAIERFNRALDLDPDFYPAHWYLANALTHKGLYQQAIAELEKVREVQPRPGIVADLGYVYAISGDRTRAYQALSELKDLSQRQYVSPYGFAIIYAGLGEKEQALDWLDKGYEERSVFFLIKVDPCMDSLRSEIRFQNLLRRMKLIV